MGVDLGLGPVGFHRHSASLSGQPHSLIRLFVLKFVAGKPSACWPYVMLFYSFPFHTPYYVCNG